jgi:SpoVK/Ycf46/Vps4 family AAA+-type ATPase
MTLLPAVSAAGVRYKDAAFEALLQHLHRGSAITQPTMLAFAGMPRAQLDAAARALAGRLGREILRFDPQKIVSKYIGETEKNLRQLLSRAESTGAILLFDEGDALFGPRTNVQDAHDRYANLETSYLLARIEAHRGLMIIFFNATSEAQKLRGRIRPVAVRFPPF